MICDRYTLDSAAHLRFRYGPERSLRFQSRLIRLVSPRPLRSYFLDVPAPTAYARKTERYSVEDLALLAQLYREERAWLRIEHLDGERPRAELCTEIAEDVWGALSDERKR